VESKEAARDAKDAGLEYLRSDNSTLMLKFSGNWKLAPGLLSTQELERQLEAGPQVSAVVFQTGELRDWDSGLIAFLVKLAELCEAKEIKIEPQGLPEGARRLVNLAVAVPEAEGARQDAKRKRLAATIGHQVIDAIESWHEFLVFVGEITIASVKFLLGRARFRRRDLWLFIQDAGARAFPIVTLISVLIGLILAFVGAVQLEQFGAEIYVANLVSVAMAREMAATMTAIVMAGRTGAAYAAQLGTMQVNEEVDALTTLGISAIEFLVVPRMLALILMMPLLYFYSNLLGILGGSIVGTGMLGISWTEYINQTQSAVTLWDFIGGFIKACVFGYLVAVAGCLKGIQCGRSALAVGQATTAAVVTAIVYIIVADALLTVLFDLLGI